MILDTAKSSEEAEDIKILNISIYRKMCTMLWLYDSMIEWIYSDDTKNTKDTNQQHK